MARSEELDYAVKAFIVQHLACFVSPSDVVRAVKDEFQIEVTRQRVHYYDPTRKPVAIMDPGLRDLFETAREEFRGRIKNIRIANAAAQLEALDRMLDLAEQRKQIPMVIALVEAASKIAGTVTTKVDVKHSGAVEVVDGARQRVFDRLDDLRERIAGRVDGLAAASGASRAPEGVE